MKTQMSAYILLLAFVPVILIILYLWQYSSNSFSDIILNSSMESYHTKVAQIENYAENFLQVFDGIVEDGRLEESIKHDNNPSLTAWWLKQIMNEHLSGYRADLVGIYLLTEKDREYLFNYWPEIYHISIRNEAKKKYGKVKAVAQNVGGEQEFYTQVCEFQEVACTAVAKALYDEKGRVYARMVFLMKNNSLSDFTEAEKLPWGFKIVSGDNLLSISDNYEGLLQKAKMEYWEVDRLNWGFTCAVDTSEIQKQALLKFSGALIITIAIYIIVLILLMYAISRQLKKQELIIRCQNEKNIRSVKQQKTAELKALELEINPHYLYNTLNSINGMAIEHQDYQLSRMLKIFSSNLIYILEDRYQPVVLQKEMQWLEEYLQLQKYRFTEKFDYEIDAEPGVEELLIYKLLLQPFVENAVLHGFAKLQSGGMLTILLYKEKDSIHIQIYDNGQGIEEGKLLKIQKMLMDPSVETEVGLGILNSCRRMQGYYGEQGIINIESAVGDGTTVEIILPIIQKKGEK
ncbi:MAG: sensor histidine kinase [Marvinbryantia sp.]